MNMRLVQVEFDSRMRTLMVVVLSSAVYIGTIAKAQSSTPYQVLQRASAFAGPRAGTIMIDDFNQRNFQGDSKSPLLVLGAYFVAHDAALAATLDGELLGVVELERMFNTRYFDLEVKMQRNPQTLLKSSATIEQVEKAADMAMYIFIKPALDELCRLAVKEKQLTPLRKSTDDCTLSYDVAVLADTRTSLPLYNAFEKLLNGTQIILVDHHHAHAAVGWLDSPFYHDTQNPRSTLVLSYDGIGNDGTLRLFAARAGNSTLTPLGKPEQVQSYGFAYDFASQIVRDLAWGSPYGSKPPCSYAVDPSCTLALPGSFMAFAATGVYRSEWASGAELLLQKGFWNDDLWPSPREGVCELITAKGKSEPPFLGGMKYFQCNGADEELSRELDRDFAATVQSSFESLILKDVRGRLADMPDWNFTSLVISGGCALNVKANTALSRGLNINAHVPPAPGDNGLALGAAWLVAPPRSQKRSLPIMFAGLPLRIAGRHAHPHDIATVAMQFGAKKLQDLKQLATLLLQDNIIAVARDRAEFGPRALTHRSLIAAAHKCSLKDRLNRLKNRRWYRPCSPVVAAEDMDVIFEPGPDVALGTPYMSFAPPLRAWVQQWLPGIAHIDNTARPQSVSQHVDPWMHSLLSEVRLLMAESHMFQECGDANNTCLNNSISNEKPPRAVGVLINTSLNSKARPIASDIEDILYMACAPAGAELNYILLEGTWLLDAHSAYFDLFCERYLASSAPKSLGTQVAVI